MRMVALIPYCCPAEGGTGASPPQAYKPGPPTAEHVIHTIYHSVLSHRQEGTVYWPPSHANSQAYVQTGGEARLALRRYNYKVSHLRPGYSVLTRHGRY